LGVILPRLLFEGLRAGKAAALPTQLWAAAKLPSDPEVLPGAGFKHDSGGVTAFDIESPLYKDQQKLVVAAGLQLLAAAGLIEPAWEGLGSVSELEGGASEGEEAAGRWQVGGTLMQLVAGMDEKHGMQVSGEGRSRGQGSEGQGARGVRGARGVGER